MLHSELVVNQGYGGLNPVSFGSERCASLHAFGPAVRTHWLLHYVVSGRGIYRREGREYPVRAGEIFVIRPYEETFYRADAERPWEYVWIGFTADFPLPEAFAQAVVSCPEANEIFARMRRCASYGNGRSAYLSSCLWSLAALLMESEPASEPDYVEKALHCIHSEYGTPLTVAGIAERLNLDRSYFSTLFSQTVGTPPGEYLRTYRLKKAAELMLLHCEKPSTAAASVGYEDLFHFSKSFKKHYGLSPRAYVRAQRIP